MKLHEVLDPQIMADRISSKKGRKPKQIKTLLKILRKGEKSKNRSSQTTKLNTYNNHDAMTGYGSTGDAFVDQGVWK